MTRMLRPGRLLGAICAATVLVPSVRSPPAVVNTSDVIEIWPVAPEPSDPTWRAVVPAAKLREALGVPGNSPATALACAISRGR